MTKKNAIVCTCLLIEAQYTEPLKKKNQGPVLASSRHWEKPYGREEVFDDFD